MKEAISAWTRLRSVDEIVSACLAADVPAGPVWDLQPALFSDAPRTAAADPRLGEHTDSVLQGLGVSADELAGLRDRGAV